MINKNKNVQLLKPRKAARENTDKSVSSVSAISADFAVAGGGK